MDHDVVTGLSATAAPQYVPQAAATVVSEAEELDLHAEAMCTFAAYLGYDYHMVELGDLLGHLAIAILRCQLGPLGHVRTFCAYCFKHGPVNVVSSHELVCSDNPHPTYFPRSDAESSEL